MLMMLQNTPRRVRAHRAASPVHVLALVLCVALALHAFSTPAQAQSAPATHTLEIAIEVRMPQPQAFFVLIRQAPPISVERLPPHLRPAWIRARRASEGVIVRQRARMVATRALAERRRAIDDAPEAARDGLRTQLSQERQRLDAEYADVDVLERMEGQRLRQALAQARRSSREHGLGQLALAELELQCANFDYTRALDHYELQLEAGDEADEPPDHPSFEPVLLPAARAARRLHGDWRAWALYLHAYASAELGDEVGAVADYREILAMPWSPVHAEVAFRLGEAAYEVGDWQAAATYYRRALPDLRYGSLAAYKLAWAELRAENWAEARDSAVELLDEPDEIGDEAWRSILPRSLARLADYDGSSLPASVSAPQRAATLLALSKLLLDSAGDVEASRRALDASVRAHANGDEVASLRRRIDDSSSDRSRIERWVYSTVWRCAPGYRLESFVASGRFNASSIGFSEVRDAGAASTCLEQYFSAPPRRGAAFRVQVQRAR